MIRRRKRQLEVQRTPKTREQLEAEFGQVWDTKELAREFVVTAIIRPLIVVRRKADDVVGTLTVQEKPRFYFAFEPGKGYPLSDFSNLRTKSSNESAIRYTFWNLSSAGMAAPCSSR